MLGIYKSIQLLLLVFLIFPVLGRSDACQDGPLTSIRRNIFEIARAVAPPKIVPSSKCVRKFKDFEIFKNVERDEVQKAIQMMVDLHLGNAFRDLGDERDFYHGHMLVEAPEGTKKMNATKLPNAQPFAILFHTQENYSRKDTKTQKTIYEYFAPEERNWLAFLKPTLKIENANQYKNANQPSRFSVYEVARTINIEMLDPKLLKKKVADYGRFGQFQFKETKCRHLPENLRQVGNLIEINIPNHKTICLELLSLDCEFDLNQCEASCLDK
jgi:hypothetical protein